MEIDPKIKIKKVKGFPIIIVRIECPNCGGVGKIYPDYLSGNAGGYGGDLFGADFRETCKRCNGLKQIDIKPNHPDFKEHYIEALEEIIEDYTKSYRRLNEQANFKLKSIKKYSKELDKIINK